MKTEHGHSHEAIRARIGAPNARGYLRDTVYGGIDGAITTFAIVAGVQGAGLSSGIILALGFANVLADGFSMAASNYSGTKSELDDLARIRAVEESHIRDTPEGEREELREILRLKGLTGQVLEDATAAISARKSTWIDMMVVDEYGLSPTYPNPLRAALATFLAFMVAGVIPLLPFVFAQGDPLTLSASLTGAVFFGIGALKSHWSLAPWWRSGLETLLIGALAASIAYGVGHLFRGVAA